MSYDSVSIREVMERINNPSNGWYLPQIQRQYVWGARWNSEEYIYLLLDSLYRRYPIGGLVVWETDQAIPFREFVNDYYPGQFAKEVDRGRWGCHKSLVYDGQQRLQTLRSVLYYGFNNRVLFFNLLFDKDSAEPDETGFTFLDKGKEAASHFMRMTELTVPCDPKEKAKLEIRYTKGMNFNEDQELLVKTNISALWDVFVDRNMKSIACFKVVTNDKAEVNEIFRRLNTGGISLTEIEMVLAKLKAKYSDYEENLWNISSDIVSTTGGFNFTSSEILQFFYLLVFGTIKVENDRVKPEHIDILNDHLLQSKQVLLELFEGYLWGQLKINHELIIPRRQALLPIAVYLASRKTGGHTYEIKKFTSSNTRLIHQYFILSQFCDWNTQTMVNAFSQQAKTAGLDGSDFPLDAIKRIASNKNRTDTLHYHQFISQPWLALKILTPNRQYIFHESKPQVDHIFPLGLQGMDETYRTRVDVLWNFQPMPAGVNQYKRARHPLEFFRSTDGAKYVGDYDFLPNLTSDRWSDEKRFLRYRHKKMRQQLWIKHALKLKRPRS